jgi:hypothetical protein
MAGENNTGGVAPTVTPVPVPGGPTITEQAAVDLLRKRGNAPAAPQADATVGTAPPAAVTTDPPKETPAPQGTDDGRVVDVDELLDDTTEDQSKDTVDEPSDVKDEDAGAVVFKLEDGTDVTHEEARNGYLRQADYTTKTTQLTELRTAVDERVQVNHQAVEFFNNVVPKFLDHMEKTLIPPKPDDGMRVTDPIGYWDRLNAHQQGLKDYQTLLQVKQAAGVAAEEMSAAHFQEWVKDQSIKLLEAIPQWSNPKVRARDQTAIVAYAKSKGFSEQEIARADHRLVAAMLDAVVGKKVREGGFKAFKPGTRNTTISAKDTAGGVDRQSQERERQQQRQKLESAQRPSEKMAAGVQLLRQRSAAMNGTGRA